jgi:peptidoglycan/LPS O-acetylase OafA/YrhL
MRVNDVNLTTIAHGGGSFIMKYRREVDGLRTLAVLPVILFHAGFTVFSGGFVGVDIFFVISGYLITTILLSELDEGQFSIVRFYERRARRILPALFVVIVTCLPFAWLWMTPIQLKEFGSSIAAVIVFSSNILFWKEDGYFAAAAELKPLLHTWSLAVEEQFYLFFPPALAVAWRFGRQRLFWLIVGVAIISLCATELVMRRDASANFYLIPTRAWELMAGSLCAFVMLNNPVKPNNAASMLGFAAIIFSIFVYSDTTPFPSIYALAPVGGAVLIILFAQRETFVASLLATRPFVGIGLLSYSAYLWHQPIFAFARIRSLTDPSLTLMAGLTLLSMSLAYLSWRYIEQPFRGGSGRLLDTRKSLFTISAVTGLALAAIGLVFMQDNGMRSRFDAHSLAIADAAQARTANSRCTFRLKRPIPPAMDTGCISPDKKGRIDVLLLGDSHSAAVAPRVQQLLASRDVGSLNLSYDACMPAIGLSRYNVGEEQPCSKYMQRAIAYARKSKVKTIVILARYSIYLEGTQFDNEEGGMTHGPSIIVDEENRQPFFGHPDGQRERRATKLFIESLESLAREFRLIIVYPIPETGWNVPQLAFKQSIFGGEKTEVSTSWHAFSARNLTVTKAFDSLLPNNITRVRPSDILCPVPVKRCINTVKGMPIYFDDNHLNKIGVDLIAPSIASSIERALATPHYAQHSAANSRSPADRF